jgi:hypothetical protein
MSVDWTIVFVACLYLTKRSCRLSKIIAGLTKQAGVLDFADLDVEVVYVHLCLNSLVF